MRGTRYTHKSHAEFGSEWFRMVQIGFPSIPHDDGNYGPEFGHVLSLRAIKDIYIPPLNVHRGHEHTEANGMRYRGDTEYHNPSGPTLCDPRRGSP